MFVQALFNPIALPLTSVVAPTVYAITQCQHDSLCINYSNWRDSRHRETLLCVCVCAYPIISSDDVLSKLLYYNPQQRERRGLDIEQKHSYKLCSTYFSVQWNIYYHHSVCGVHLLVMCTAIFIHHEYSALVDWYQIESVCRNKHTY